MEGTKCVFSFITWKSYIIVAVMVAMGAFAVVVMSCFRTGMLQTDQIHRGRVFHSIFNYPWNHIFLTVRAIGFGRFDDLFSVHICLG